MAKSTDELMKVLLSKQDIREYLGQNGGEMLSESLAEYLEKMLTEHELRKNDVIREAGIERSYCYQIFRGAKANPSRDVLIALAFSIGMTLSETQTMLRIANMAMLYPRIRRDSIIIRTLAQGQSLYECDLLLAQNNEEPVRK